MAQRTAVIPLALMLILVILGGLDAVLLESDLLKQGLATPEPGVADITEQPLQPAVQQPSGTGVRKISGPDVLATLTTQGFTFQETRERTLMEQIIPAGETPVQKNALLRRGDRSGLLAWTESPQVKVYFLALKEALHTSFSPDVQDLIDETQQREGKPTRNFLTFLDPNLSQERVVFVRVRERLYELHLAKGEEDAIYDLVEALTE